MLHFGLLLSGIALFSFAAPAQDFEDLEHFHLEMTSDYWRLGVKGDVQSGSNAIDLARDLGVAQDRFTFAGKVVIKPGRKHRINFEYIPLRANGVNDLSRQIEYGGETYGIQDRISTLTKLTHIAAGYQYDFVSHPRGHLGLEVGVAYLQFEGILRSLRTNLSASEKAQVPVPLVGVEGRSFLIPGRKLLNVHGHVRGMSAGSYGRYIDFGTGAGIGIGPITFNVGYRRLDIEAQNNKTGSAAIAARPQFSGLTLGLQFRDR